MRCKVLPRKKVLSTMNIFIEKSLLAVLALNIAGCEKIGGLRFLFDSSTETPLEKQTSLHVEVTPNTGMSILIDNVHKATRSPYDSQTLAPGAHTVEVRAMGYFPITLPFELEAGTPLQLPIALRPRPLSPTLPLPKAVP